MRHRGKPPRADTARRRSRAWAGPGSIGSGHETRRGHRCARIDPVRDRHLRAMPWIPGNRRDLRRGAPRSAIGARLCREHRACTAGSACRSGGGGAGVRRRRAAAPAAGGLVPPLVPPFGQPARQAARAGGGCLRHPACRRLILVAARTSGPGHRPRRSCRRRRPPTNRRQSANRIWGSRRHRLRPRRQPRHPDRQERPQPPTPVAQALADPCAPGSSATSRGGARSKFETNAAKPAPIPQSKTASVLGPDPDCAVSVGASEGGRNPRADRGPVRAARPAAKIGTLDRDPAAAAAPAPYAGDARPASPAMHPSSVQPAR